MKKIFTIILVAAGTIGAASAQSKHQKSVAYNDHAKNSYGYDDHTGYGKSNTSGYNDNYNSYREKQQRLERMNRGYGQKMAFLQNNRRLNRRQKAQQIKRLQDHRQNEMSQVEYRYAKNNHDGNRRTAGHDEHR